MIPGRVAKSAKFQMRSRCPRRITDDHRLAARRCPLPQPALQHLRRPVSFQVAVFGAFSAAWTAVALLVSGPRCHLGTQAVGVLALVGAASMFCAPAAGPAAA